MKHYLILIRVVVSYVMLHVAPAAEKPNILWITSEDNSSHWLGCYGNEQAKTPCIDRLAGQGILFENAYSNAPVCAVARATILMGAYSPTMGTQHMRSRHAIPASFRPYVSYLREAGYYCTNQHKTDYNFKGNDNSYWDQSSQTAHYKNRPANKPFFAIINLQTSHESSLFGNKDPEPKRLQPSEVMLPPYLPDLPEIRKDIARYHDRITEMDEQVGRILDELEKAGLAEDTIVFYYADHGGIVPRGKRYLEQTGVKVPLLVRVPEKFRHLTPFKAGERVNEPVSFVDLAPTLLSLLDLPAPSHMQGRAFLGKKRVAPAADEMEYLYADRFDELYGMRRGLTDGKWKYMRNFNPDFPLAPYSFYQFGQPGWTAYQKAYQQRKLSGYHKAQWEAPGNAEQLYDLSADPWEMNNLEKDPEHAARLAALRQRLNETMIQTRDTGLIPEPLFADLTSQSTIAEFARSSSFDIHKISELAFVATERDVKNIARLRAAIASDDIVECYWGLVGMRLLDKRAISDADHVQALLKHANACIRTTAADALIAMGKTDVAADALVADVTTPMDSCALLNLVNTIRRHNLLERLPAGWNKGKALKMDGQNYLQRFSERMDEK